MYLQKIKTTKTMAVSGNYHKIIKRPDRVSLYYYGYEFKEEYGIHKNKNYNIMINLDEVTG